MGEKQENTDFGKCLESGRRETLWECRDWEGCERAHHIWPNILTPSLCFGKGLQTATSSGFLDAKRAKIGFSSPCSVSLIQLVWRMSRCQG